LRLDSLSSRIQEELLGVSVPDKCLQHDVSCSNKFSNSVHWQSRNEIEWSVLLNSELAFPVDWLSFFIVTVDDCPFLIGTVSSCLGNHISTINVLVTFNCKHEISDIDEIVALVFEQLEPFTIGG